MRGLCHTPYIGSTSACFRSGRVCRPEATHAVYGRRRWKTENGRPSENAASAMKVECVAQRRTRSLFYRQLSRTIRKSASVVEQQTIRVGWQDKRQRPSENTVLLFSDGLCGGGLTALAAKAGGRGVRPAAG
ncbi:hypothetical protein [Kingella potus]|uniref:hypothetical protein n=1 Tax=Kingella potus TaxID=265175 RepID=UPI001FD1404D|nr:hypothetical protein [Kingella potus]UOP01026.1 hypothetical protein LVJ84_01155 [Kingella potus]